MIGGASATFLVFQSRTMRRLPLPAVIGIASVLLIAPPIVGYHVFAEERVLATPLTVTF